VNGHTVIQNGHRPREIVVEILHNDSEGFGWPDIAATI
jgi:hypothetical protein